MRRNPPKSSTCQRRLETVRFAMTVLTAETRRPGAHKIERATGFRVDFAQNWEHALACCEQVSAFTPFQDRRWLDAWYRAFAGFREIEPLIAIVSQAATSEPVALFPLVRRGRRGVGRLEFT